MENRNPPEVIVSIETFKYPYNGRCIESETFLSEKIFSSTISKSKNVVKTAKWTIVVV